MIILAAYLPPSRPMFVADLTACYGGGFPFLMAGDLNAKDDDWNSRQCTRWGKFLGDSADENSCLIFARDSQITRPNNLSATPAVSDIVITKNIPFLVYLTSCCALSSDNLPVLIGTACRSSFHHPTERPYLRRTDWANLQTHLQDLIPIDLELHNEMAIDTCVENFSGAVLKALVAYTAKCRPCEYLRPSMTAGIQYEIRLKNRLRRRWPIARYASPRAEVNRLQRSVTRRLN